MLVQLRRQQLHDLAKAYGIEVTPDAPKDEILPAMVAAETKGVFKGEPKLPEYLAKAAGDPNWEKLIVPDVNLNDRKFLYKMCKENGIKTEIGLSAEQLRGMLKEAGVL